MITCVHLKVLSISLSLLSLVLFQVAIIVHSSLRTSTLKHPDTQIHVIDTLSAGGEVDLIVEKINSLIDQGFSYEEIVEAITAYQEKRSCSLSLLRSITWSKMVV